MGLQETFASHGEQAVLISIELNNRIISWQQEWTKFLRTKKFSGPLEGFKEGSPFHSEVSWQGWLKAQGNCDWKWGRWFPWQARAARCQYFII